MTCLTCGGIIQGSCRSIVESNNERILNKNLVIANRSRVSCAHNTSTASIGLITPWSWNLGQGSLKVTGNETIGYIIQDLLLVELLYVEYYRDLEIWVIGHSKSSKMVSFESVGTVSCLPSIVTIAVSLAISEIFSVKNGLTLKYGFGVVQCHWKRRGSKDCMTFY